MTSFSYVNQYPKLYPEILQIKQAKGLMRGGFAGSEVLINNSVIHNIYKDIIILLRMNKLLDTPVQSDSFAIIRENDY
jgi:hypothetical protein